MLTHKPDGVEGFSGARDWGSRNFSINHINMQRLANGISRHCNVDLCQDAAAPFRPSTAFGSNGISF